MSNDSNISIVKEIINRDRVLAERENSIEDHIEDNELPEINSKWAVDVDRGKYWESGETKDTLDSGAYLTLYDDRLGFYFKKMTMINDDIIDLPDNSSRQVIEEIEKFWKLEDKFKTRGFIYKRGILLWGDPGSGKTSTIRLASLDIIKRGGVVIYGTDSHNALNCLQILRKVEPERPIVMILEDFETLIVDKREENIWLSILDGEAQVNKIVFLATTNYPENLDKRFIDRPSRFDTIQKIEMPTADARKLYFKSKEPSLTKVELDEWVKKSKGFSIAHLKEMIIGVKCLDQSLNVVVDKIKEMRDRKLHSNKAIDKETKFGFGNN